MQNIIRNIKRKIKLSLMGINPKRCGYLADTAYIARNCKVYNQENLYLYDGANLSENAIIMNSRARFVMKKGSGAAFGFVAITGNHMSIPGMAHHDVTDAIKDKYDPEKQMDKDIIIDEDCWIGANTTILSGVTIGRGSVVGTGSVVRYSIPPYSVVMGNPAKVVGLRFLSIGDIIKHEEMLYSEDERLPIELLEKIYDKYLLKRRKEILNYIRI